jgi:hypothetical protein
MPKQAPKACVSIPNRFYPVPGLVRKKRADKFTAKFAKTPWKSKVNNLKMPGKFNSRLSLGNSWLVLKHAIRLAWWNGTPSQKLCDANDLKFYPLRIVLVYYPGERQNQVALH